MKWLSILLLVLLCSCTNYYEVGKSLCENLEITKNDMEMVHSDGSGSIWIVRDLDGNIWRFRMMEMSIIESNIIFSVKE